MPCCTGCVEGRISAEVTGHAVVIRAFEQLGSLRVKVFFQQLVYARLAILPWGNKHVVAILSNKVECLVAIKPRRQAPLRVFKIPIRNQGRAC